jgi:hypothetical protein
LAKLFFKKFINNYKKMNLKNFIILLIIASYIQCLPHGASATVYEASDLHNSVSRSETISNLFIENWETLKEENFYLYIDGRINKVTDFTINTYNAGTGNYEERKLNLIRTYGNLTLAMPIGEFRKDKGGSDLLIALSTSGFHYGLTGDVYIDRGYAGTETASDYKHAQFFDDIYAISVLYRPYLTIHYGLIVNNKYIPNNNGTIEYSHPEASQTKQFFMTEIYDLLSFSTNIDKNKSQSLKFEIALTKLFLLFDETYKEKLPEIKISYKNIRIYNDADYDPVWSKSPFYNGNPKDSIATFPEDHSKLNIFSINVNQPLIKNFKLEGQISLQYINHDIYEKNTMKKINAPAIKQCHLLIYYSSKTINEGIEETGYLRSYAGLSRYWDPAIKIHRDNPQKGYGVYGCIIGSDFNFVYLGGGLRAMYNFSSELEKLAESVDKWSFEGNLFLKI